MAIFQFEAMNAAGQEIKDELDAVSTQEAITKIRGLGYFPTKIKEKGAKKRVPGAAAAGRRKKAAGARAFGRVSQKMLTQFTRQLSTLQDAGLPILRSLRILEQQQKPGLLRVVVRQVGEDVEGGATLSEAMAKHPRAFDRLYVNMVQAGEAGGVLDVILIRLAEFMEKAQALKRRVVSAMIYPIAVISFAVLIVSGIMYFVIPSFVQIFADFETALPGPTKMLMGMSEWFRDAGGGVPGAAVIVVAPIAVIMFVKLVRQSQTGRYVVDVIKLKLPIMGNILAKTSVARFSRTLGTLINAGVPILEAINITKETSGNEVYAKALGQVHDAIREGDSFANPLRAAKVVDSIVTNMIDVGEETGDLDKMMMKVADNYDDEVETAVSGLVSLLEPIMVIALGLIVGFIVVSLFLPLVTMIEGVSGGAA